MSEKTKISWCDSTANFWEGCTKVSAGCQNCYAEARDKRFTGGKLWGKGAPRRKSKSAVKDCLRWNKKEWICDECGDDYCVSPDVCSGCGVNPPIHRRRVFSLSLGDWLDPEVPVEWLAEMLETIMECDQLQFILCTKRPELWRQRMQEVVKWMKSPEGRTFAYLWLTDWLRVEPHVPNIPKNIILLTSVENQKSADERIPALLEIPAVCHGLSLEPLLEAVKISGEHLLANLTENSPNQTLRWLIIGGESGPNARPCNVDWIRSLVAQGKAAGVATFVKQLGAFVIQQDANRPTEQLWPAWTRFTANVACSPGTTLIDLRDFKGGDISDWPEDFRVQEFPSL